MKYFQKKVTTKQNYLKKFVITEAIMADKIMHTPNFFYAPDYQTAKQVLGDDKIDFIQTVQIDFIDQEQKIAEKCDEVQIRCLVFPEMQIEMSNLTVSSIDAERKIIFTNCDLHSCEQVVMLKDSGPTSFSDYKPNDYPRLVSDIKKHNEIVKELIGEDCKGLSFIWKQCLSITINKHFETNVEKICANCIIVDKLVLVNSSLG